MSKQYITRVLTIALFVISLPGVTSGQDDLAPERKAQVDSLALEKVRDLSKYISIIGDKDTPASEASRVMDRTMELFMEGSEMGVSHLHKEEVKYYPVREYLKRLMMLNYESVNIDWYDIQYISNLEKQPDGTYVGVITIYQKFQGKGKEGMKYQDVTKKDITVYVKRKQTQINGRLINFWDVMLGDIRVSATRAADN